MKIALPPCLPVLEKEIKFAIISLNSGARTHTKLQYLLEDKKKSITDEDGHKGMNGVPIPSVQETILVIVHRI